MNRRSFLVASGSVILSGAATSRWQRSTFALDFELSTVPKRKPSNIGSVLLNFSKFELIPHYVDDSKNADIKIDFSIGSYSDSVSKTVDVNNGEVISSQDLSPEIPIVLEDIEASADSVDGEVRITVKHDSIGKQTYKRQFVVTDNPLINGLVYYYPIKKGGGRVLNDGASDNDAGIDGAVWREESTVGSDSLEFDGSNDVATSNKKVGISGSSSRSMSFWMKPTQIDVKQHPINWGETNEGNAFGLWVDSSNDVYFYGHGLSAGYDYDTGFDLTKNWIHMVITYDGSTVRTYKNGSPTPTPSDNISLSTTDTDLHIGNRMDGQHYWNGYIEDVRIYNRVLSQAEANDLYNLSSPSGREVTESDIPSQSDDGVSRYKFNNNLKDAWSDNNGTNNTSVGYVNGVYGVAKDFDGGTDAVDISHGSGLDTDVFTVSAWVYWKKPSQDYHTVIDKRVSGTNANGVNYQIFINQGQQTDEVRFTTGNGSNFHNLFSGDKVPSNRWVNIVIVRRSNGDKEIYIDGNRANNGNDSFDSLAKGSEVVIGDRVGDVTKSHSWKGHIDDLRIYGTDLSEPEVERLFSLGSYRV